MKLKTHQPKIENFLPSHVKMKQQQPFVLVPFSYNNNNVNNQRNKEDSSTKVPTSEERNKRVFHITGFMRSWPLNGNFNRNYQWWMVNR